MEEAKLKVLEEDVLIGGEKWSWQKIGEISNCILNSAFLYVISDGIT